MTYTFDLSELFLFEPHANAFVYNKICTKNTCQQQLYKILFKKTDRHLCYIFTTLSGYRRWYEKTPEGFHASAGSTLYCQKTYHLAKPPAFLIFEIY